MSSPLRKINICVGAIRWNNQPTIASCILINSSQFLEKQDIEKQKQDIEYQKQDIEQSPDRKTRY